MTFQQKKILKMLSKFQGIRSLSQYFLDSKMASQEVETSAFSTWKDLKLSNIIAQVQGLDSEGNGSAVVNVASDGFGKAVAVKRFMIDDASDEAIKLVTHEIVMMRQLRSPYILSALGSLVSINSMEIWVVSSLMELGSLRRILDAYFPEGIPEAAISPIVSDCLKGLQHLHERGIVHRAVKASHILLDASGRAKLSGLRYSVSLYDVGTDSCNISSSGGSPQDRYDFPMICSQKHLNWMSPEMLQQNLLGYNEKSDIYSLGVTLAELANGFPPFSDMPKTLMLLEKLKSNPTRLLDSTTFDPSAHPQDLLFSGDKPADSGVGASVGSCSNLPTSAAGVGTFKQGAVQANLSKYAQRTFSDAFHAFHENCLELDPDIRKPAASLLSHPFIKQHKKSSSSSLSLASLVSSCCSVKAPVNDNSALDDEEADTLTMAFNTSKMIDSGLVWDF